MNNSSFNEKYLVETEQPLSEPLQLKLDQIKSMKQKGEKLYCNDFKPDIDLETLKEKFKDLQQGDKTPREFKVAGRITGFRKHGKATFADLKDPKGKLQLYLSQKVVGEEQYHKFGQLDIGDWIGVEGPLFKTRTGELSLSVQQYKLLSKSIRILPEKWHGLKDKELRYRQRYLDFLVNPQVKEVFLKRIKIIEKIREFLNQKGFLEVETPMLQTIPGGATARPFVTHHNALDIDLYLRIAPELYLKRLIVGGFEKVYEINRNFRNEGISYKHNPEFTMLEFYQMFSNYQELALLTQDLVKYAAGQALGSLKVSYRGQDINLEGDWKKISMVEAIKEIGDIEVSFDHSKEQLTKVAQGLGLEIPAFFGKGKIINQIFEAVVEPKLIQPTFIMDFPKEISPLAQQHPDNPELVERFELFIGGEEIANAFTELTDPAEQLSRFMLQSKSSDEEERLSGKIDQDFIKALEYGMPPTGGEGIGIDRLVMVLTGSESIKDVLLFPLMKPEQEPGQVNI
ncbi:MAG: lysine--tRNA ligase [Actinomycetota bacterium]|nr:lysine--tRNA ligase [Actinomycetota bacterium]